jgi:hypothetical protein
MKTGPKPQPIAIRFWKKVRRTPDCWVWTGWTNPCGYAQIWDQNRRRTMLVHRISWELHFGSIPHGKCVCHHCDNPSCVRPDHLFLGTLIDNNHDCIRKDRFARGERMKHKLTADKVRLIRKLYVRRKVGCVQLGKRFGVNRRHITKILHRKAWAHIN